MTSQNDKAKDDAGMPLFIVMNAQSGRHESENAQAVIARVLESAGRRHQIQRVRRGSDIPAAARRAAALARDQGGAVVAVGGDGTLNAVAHAAHEVDCPMGVIAQGTFNYFSRTQHLPLDPEAAVRSLLTAQVRLVQLGEINGQIFLVNASLGLYPDLLEDRERFKSRFGRSRWISLISAFWTILQEHRQLRLRIESADGTRTVRTSTLFVGNNRLQLQQVGLPQARAIERGRVAGVMVKPVGNWALVRLLMRGAMGSLGDDESVESFEFDRITVAHALAYGRRRFKVAADGEVMWLRAPLHIGVSQRPLKLLAPVEEESFLPDGGQHKTDDDATAPRL